MGGVRRRRRGFGRFSREGRRPLRFWVALAVVGLLLGVYAHRFFVIAGERRDLADLKREQQASLDEQNRLRERLALKDDKKTIEYLARRELGLIKPNEEKVIFVNPEGRE
jgi:cell division protein FtsB